MYGIGFFAKVAFLYMTQPIWRPPIWLYGKAKKGVIVVKNKFKKKGEKSVGRKSN